MSVLNSILTAESIVWAAAAVTLLLLVLHKPVAAVWMSTRRDSTTRLLKVAVYFVSFVMVAIPALILVTGQGPEGSASGWYLLLSLLFWYYLGRNCGLTKGKRDVEDLIGLDSYDGIADAQDRLYESRMRLKTRDLVVDSIKRLAKGEAEDTPLPSGGARQEPEIMDVAVEEVD